MKKFLFFLLFLAVLGGAVFFLGWAQLTVPPGSYGVMRSKTHGLDNQIIRDGEFRWVWYKLIPTNANVSIYTIEPVKHSIRSSGSLNSGKIYASLAGLEADFSWEITGELSFNLRPEILPELTDREKIQDNDGLREAEKNIAARIEAIVLNRIRAYAEDGDERRMESIIMAASIPELNREIERAFPEIENLNCTLRTVRYPDFTLYQSVRLLYREYIERQNAILSPGVGAEADRRINSRLRMDELTMYGELLTKYPILLDYMILEKEMLQNE